MEVGEYFEAVSEEPGEFGNARGVRNTFEKILTEQANRVAAMPEVTKDELMRITLDDVKLALYGQPEAEEKSEEKPEETENPEAEPEKKPEDTPETPADPGDRDPENP